MSIRVALHHSTRYRYDRSITLGPQLIRLRPAPHCPTPILSYGLKIEPAGHFINWQQDPQSNWLARIVVPEKTESLTVTVDLTVEMKVINPFDFFLEPAAEKFPFEYEPELATDLRPYLHKLECGPRFHAYLDSISRAKTETTHFLFQLNADLQQVVGYLIRMEPGIQTPDETLEKASGSCRDSAWLLVQLLRHLGLAARFASGYLIQLKQDQKSLDGPSGAEEDFTDLHAWCEVYLPGAGWVGLDPTSGLFASEGHIPLACAANPTAAAPISGELEECRVEFDFAMTVSRVLEPPRVTKPYTDHQWRAIEDLGDKIDDVLSAGDVRLTMGGEPTFISIDDMGGAEWTTAAVGPTKRAFADTLIRRLRDRFAPGGLLHYGQGKWYPGESLPRWAFALYWRGDGVPLWRNGARIATERANYVPTDEDARELAQGIARRLDLNPDYAMPAHESPWHYLAREQALPSNVDPFDSKIEDAEERARLARVFERGLKKPAGFVLPLQCWNAADRRRWRSERWHTRSGRLLLVPGDSPIGFRLPLESLPWIRPELRDFVLPDDPFGELPPLPDHNSDRQPYLSGGTHDLSWETRRQRVEQEPPSEGLSVRTALSVEPRDGRLCVFVPPTESAADYLDLLATIEDAAAEQDATIHIEGYTPPFDPRLNLIKVTPDPGVIEVNIHPSKSWRDQVAITTALYDEARQSRLGTQKFMLDGRHTGTGGGNHIVVGATRPADSPFLRRPDLLKSLLCYWQNHPSLSYLFSGLFIGPTSQAPRVDEARHDALYELEIAFGEIAERSNGSPQPWLVDRILRNLLIDVTGNTHRTEICIDKLYSPDGPAGRLGLVEFRGFEMPPHPEMVLAQALLLRALIARFWDHPYRKGLVRWGTQLHDRFMLPHFVWADFADVIADMNAAGFAFDAEWFRPHWAFRFPQYGAVQYDGVELELRQALEPWNVMGEEGAIGTTVRYVDSSVERLEVKASGLTPERHVVLANGRSVPLRTVAPGEAVAGVRYRAWSPAHSLHPTIGSHAPLVFEVWDSWRKRSLGGCTYHVAHPGGRHYEDFPVNAYEADGRRLARFEPFGFTGGLFEPSGGYPSRFPPHFGFKTTPLDKSAAVSETDSPTSSKPRALSVMRYDEMTDAIGELRPQWQAVARTFANMTPEDYASRFAAMRGMVRDNGVTYNVYDEAGGRARPWQLDIVPFVISADDWKIIESGIKQRARLANLLLRDIYGRQTLIAEGHLPPHLILGHPQFLRPLMGVEPAGGVHVHLYSADLARAPDGSWIVLSARADAPSGIGYALENRIVISQTLPDLFRDLQVERLASFFHAYREYVLALGSEMKGRAVLLTPGPHNEAYFEHAYLAHYLGLSLVEGQDLVVRDGRVFIKTLAGLERVAVIFRRLDSDFCDPLEFRAESALGVPGLAQCVREGGVVLANALGGGVIEAPSMAAYLPSAARALLGEDLEIPDIPTVWCGTEWGRKEALARLRDVVIRDSFDARQLFWRGSSARLGIEMQADEIHSLPSKLERRGATFVVQDIAPLGLAPVYENGALTAKPTSIRVFAAFTPDGYVVMPGALTRVAQNASIRALSMQSGSASKDSWVLSNGPVNSFTLLNRTDAPLPIKRTGDDAPSRAMDNLFWLGRYAERAENLVRTLRAVVLRLGDETALGANAAAGELARHLLLPQGQASRSAIEGAVKGDNTRLSGELGTLVFSPDSPHGLQRVLQAVQRTAWSVRDRLSSDTWRAIHALTAGEGNDAQGAPAGTLPYLDTQIRRAAAFEGLSAENMTRGSNWLFLDTGRRIERTMHATWLVRQMLSSLDDDIAHIQAALEIADSAMTYRYRYLNLFQAPPAIDLLLIDPSNPRSAAFQIATILRHALSLPKITPIQRKNVVKTIATEARDIIVGADPSAVAQADDSGRRAGLIELARDVGQIMPRLSDAIADAYFQHATPRRTGSALREMP